MLRRITASVLFAVLLANVACSDSTLRRRASLAMSRSAAGETNVEAVRVWSYPGYWHITGVDASSQAVWMARFLGLPDRSVRCEGMRVEVCTGDSTKFDVLLPRAFGGSVRTVVPAGGKRDSALKLHLLSSMDPLFLTISADTGTVRETNLSHSLREHDKEDYYVLMGDSLTTVGDTADQPGASLMAVGASGGKKIAFIDENGVIRFWGRAPWKRGGFENIKRVGGALPPLVACMDFERCAVFDGTGQLKHEFTAPYHTRVISVVYGGEEHGLIYIAYQDRGDELTAFNSKGERLWRNDDPAWRYARLWTVAASPTGAYIAVVLSTQAVKVVRPVNGSVVATILTQDGRARVGWMKACNGQQDILIAAGATEVVAYDFRERVTSGKEDYVKKEVMLSSDN